MSAALRPLDVVLAAFIRDGLPVVVKCEGGAETTAVLADHADREPALVLGDVRNALVDLADRRGIPQYQVDLRVELAVPVEVTHPVDLFRPDLQRRERLEVGRRVIASEV